MTTESIAAANLARAERRIAEGKAIKGLQGITSRRLPPRSRNHSRKVKIIR